MINDDMTYNEISLLKSDISSFIEYLSNYSHQENFSISQNDKDFFSFLCKRICFFKIINQMSQPIYSAKVLISDFYNLIITIIKNQKRYIYLNERSIIENYMRLILSTSLENDHITLNLFNKLQSNHTDIFTKDTFSLLKSEYRMSCSFVHGGAELEETLIAYFNKYVEDNSSLAERQKYYDRLKKVVQNYDLAFLHEHTSLIDSAFHRKKTVLEYLLGKKYVETLFKIK